MKKGGTRKPTKKPYDERHIYAFCQEHHVEPDNTNGIFDAIDAYGVLDEDEKDRLPEVLVAREVDYAGGLMIRSKQSIPCERFDPEIVKLCRVINEFPGIMTVSSCQGYIDGHSSEYKPWSVYFQPTPRITASRYRSIEFLVFLINGGLSIERGFDVSLEVHSAAPYLNGPGTCLSFCIEGWNEHPDQLATLIESTRARVFVDRPY